MRKSVKAEKTKNGRMILRSLDGQLAGSLPGAPKITPMPKALPPVPPTAKDGKRVKMSFAARIANRDLLETLYMEKGANTHLAIQLVSLASDSEVYAELKRAGIEPNL
jgi:hypothetical protein